MLKFHAAAAAACGYTRLRSPAGTGNMLRFAPPVSTAAGAVAAAVVPWWYARNMLIAENWCTTRYVSWTMGGILFCKKLTTTRRVNDEEK